MLLLKDSIEEAFDLLALPDWLPLNEKNPVLLRFEQLQGLRTKTGCGEDLEEEGIYLLCCREVNLTVCRQHATEGRNRICLECLGICLLDRCPSCHATRVCMLDNNKSRFLGELVDQLNCRVNVYKVVI